MRKAQLIDLETCKEKIEKYVSHVMLSQVLKFLATSYIHIQINK